MEIFTDQYFRRHPAFPHDLIVKINNLRQRTSIDSNLRDEICLAIDERILLDKNLGNSYACTRNLLESIEKLPHPSDGDEDDSENFKKFSEPQDRYVEIQDFSMVEQFVQKTNASFYKRKVKIIKPEDVDSSKLFGSGPSGEGCMSLFLKTAIDMKTFAPLMVFWDAGKLFKDPSMSINFLKLITSEDPYKRSKYPDRFMNFPIDLSQMAMIFIVKSSADLPSSMKEKLKSLPSPKPDIIDVAEDPYESLGPPIMITRQALGRKGVLGNFYNTKKDLVYEQNFFKKDLPEHILNFENPNQKSNKQIYGDIYEKKFSGLEIENELQASIIAKNQFGTKIDGHANFLLERRMYGNEIMYALVYRCHKRTISLNFEHMKEFLQNHYTEIHSDATHIITGIEYGGVAVFKLTGICNSKEESEIRRFKENLKRILNSIRDTSTVDHVILDDNLSITIYHDLKSQPMPVSNIDKAKEFYRNFECQIDASTLTFDLNYEQGVPIKFHLTPIHCFQKFCQFSIPHDRRVLEVPKNEFNKILRILDDFELNKIDLHDINRLFNSYDYAVPEVSLRMLENRIQTVILLEQKIMDAIAMFFLKSRNERTTSSGISDAYEASGNNRLSVKAEIQKLQPVIEKIKYVQKLEANHVIYVERHEKLLQKIRDEYCEMCYIFVGYFSEIDEAFQDHKTYFDNMVSKQNVRAFFVDWQIHLDRLKEVFEGCPKFDMNQIKNKILKCKNMSEDEFKPSFYFVNIKEPVPWN